MKAFFLSLFLLFSYNSTTESNVKYLDPSIKYAHTAYLNLKKTNINLKPIIIVVNFDLPSTSKRLFLIDIKTNKIIQSYYVAHGQNTGSKYAISFSNESNSHKSSLGVFITTDFYIGKHGKSLKLNGLDKGFNTNAANRGIVIHGCSYTNENYMKKEGRAGRSWGCFAIDETLRNQLFSTIGPNTLLFAYSNNKQYLTNSKYLKE